MYSKWLCTHLHEKRHFYVRNVRIWYGILCTELYGLKKILYGICTEFFWKVCGHPEYVQALQFVAGDICGFFFYMKGLGAWATRCPRTPPDL